MLQIPDEFDNILEYALALPYLPANKITEGIGIVSNLMNLNRVPHTDRFSRYFHRMWLPITDVISVFDQPTRTNNVCENFHLYAKDFLGIRQGLWVMLGML